MGRTSCPRVHVMSSMRGRLGSVICAAVGVVTSIRHLSARQLASVPSEQEM